jgi:cell division septum initiation protein DivIVA
MWSGRQAGDSRSGPKEDPLPEPTFGKVRRGYDPDEVSRYVQTLTTRIRILENHADELESDLDQARRQLDDGRGQLDETRGQLEEARRQLQEAADDPYAAISTRMADVMRAFDQEFERVQGEAQAEAGRVLDEARSDADRIRLDAQANAEEVRAGAERAAKEAREQAHELLSGLESRRSSLLEEIRALKDRMLEAARAIIPASDADQSADDVTIVDDDAASEGTAGSRQPSAEGREDLGPVLGDGDRMFEVRRE